MTSDLDRWGETLEIEGALADLTPRWIAERITHLASIGDLAGAAHFRAIAS